MAEDVIEPAGMSLAGVAAVYQAVGFRDDLVDDLQLVRRLEGEVFVTIIDGRVVGASSCLAFTHSGWIGGVAVLPELARRGSANDSPGRRWPRWNAEAWERSCSMPLRWRGRSTSAWDSAPTRSSSRCADGSRRIALSSCRGCGAAGPPIWIRSSAGIYPWDGTARTTAKCLQAWLKFDALQDLPVSEMLDMLQQADRIATDSASSRTALGVLQAATAENAQLRLEKDRLSQEAVRAGQAAGSSAGLRRGLVALARCRRSEREDA